MANLTVVIPDDVLEAARILAIRQETSVIQIVREYLEAVVKVDVRRVGARERLASLALRYEAGTFLRDEV